MEESTIGSRIKQLRVLLNKRQNDFADDLETTQGNISQIENGTCIPTGNFFQRIAEKFPDANFNWIIAGEGKPLKNVGNDPNDDPSARNEIDDKVAKKLDKTIKELNSEIQRLRDDNRRLIHLADMVLSKASTKE